MFKLEFDPSDKQLAVALGTALVQYGIGDVNMPDAEPEPRTAGKHAGLAAPYNVEQTQEAEPCPGTVTSDESEPEEVNEPDPCADDAPVDEHGTPHNPKYCVGVKSKNKFYKSGNNKGQWIKGKGVEESDYNEWYESVRPLPEETDAPREAEQNVDTSVAFGTKQDAPPAEATGDFNTVADLMEYISQRQTDGTLTQQNVNQAYTDLNIKATDLFTGEEATISANVAKLGNYLMQVKG